MLLIGRCRFRGVAWANCLYPTLTLLHSEWPKLYGVLAVLSAIELDVYGCIVKWKVLLLTEKFIKFFAAILKTS